MSQSIFYLIGGLGFFFLGMSQMSDGLKKLAGGRLKAILHMVTSLPVIGVLIGALITCLIQSSSATTVMTVGFVNAGLLTLKQAISVVMGANIGTTFTAWLVSAMSIFKITQYALPAVGIGFAIMALGRSRKTKAIGEVLVGFGMLFIGLDFIKDAFAPLKDSDTVKNIFVQFSHNPLLGVAMGVVFTVLLQSSSATVAIIQVLALNGVISFDAAIPLILGDNIGTTITAQLAAAAGTNLQARRTAMSHTLFNVFGVSYMLIFVYTGWYTKAIEALFPTPNVMVKIAIAHSAFNVVNALVFLPFIGALEKASIWLVPQRKDVVDLGTQYLERHLLETPTLAMEQARKEAVYMLKVAKKAVSSAVDGLLENDLNKLDKVVEYERATDNLQSEITQYLVDLSQRELAKEESEEIPVWIHIVNDLERIGDHSQNISELSRRKIEDKLPFSDPAMKEISQMWEQVNSMLIEADQALKTNDDKIAKRMLEREDIINHLHDRFKEAHIQRLNDGTCQLAAGFLFLEFMDNMEKVGDRLTNVAQSVIGKMRWRALIQNAQLAES